MRPVHGRPRSASASATDDSPNHVKLAAYRSRAVALAGVVPTLARTSRTDHACPRHAAAVHRRREATHRADGCWVERADCRTKNDGRVLLHDGAPDASSSVRRPHWSGSVTIRPVSATERHLRRGLRMCCSVVDQSGGRTRPAMSGDAAPAFVQRRRSISGSAAHKAGPPCQTR